MEKRYTFIVGFGKAKALMPIQLKAAIFGLLGFILMLAAIPAQAQLPPYEFTNAGATGRFGPTQADLDAAYSGTNLAGNVTSNNGIQEWTVPYSGTYTIEVAGAEGGRGGGRPGGRGAMMKGDFSLSSGEVIRILVGQKPQDRPGVGVNDAGAGGGGSFVTREDNTPLIVAGGGGGGGGAQDGVHATTARNGTNSGGISGLGGINGGGGGGGQYGTAGTQIQPGGTGTGCSWGAGGGGFYTRGGYNCNGALPHIQGHAFLDGGLGGEPDTRYAGPEGGFGGGAGVGHRASAGGGWSGGGGDGQSNGGGGGGSYNSGIERDSADGVNLGHGYVKITPLATGALNDAGVVSIDHPNVYCPGDHDVIVTLQNFGMNQIHDVEVHWTVNGVLQPHLDHVGTIDTFGGANPPSVQVTLGSYFFTDAEYDVIAWTELPNGEVDTVPGNDSTHAQLKSHLPPPTTLRADSWTSTTSEISWSGGNTPNTWLYVNVPQGNPLSGVGTFSSSRNVSLSGLTPSTTYNFYVREVCPTGDTSSWAGPMTYCTAADGAITVGAGGDFGSLNAAFNFLTSCGIDGDVEVFVNPGNYNTNVNVTNIPNLGPNMNLLIEGTGSSPSDVRIFNNNGRTMGFTGVSHITFRNLSIESETDDVNEEALFFANSNNITIDNVHFMREPTDINNRYVLRANNTYNFTVNNSRFEGGGGSIFVSGAGGEGPHNVEITDNVLNNSGFRGMTLQNLENTLVHGNRISLNTSENDQAIGLFITGSQQSEITANAFANNGATAMHIQGENADRSTRSLIANNMVEAGFRSSLATGGGIYSHQSSNLDIYHNSIHQDRSGGNLFRITSSSSPEGFDIRNNIFFYSGGGNGRAVIENAAAIDVLDHNIYYSTGSSLYNFDGTIYNNWAMYQMGESTDQNSHYINPAFNGARDLRIANSNQIRYGVSLGVDYDFFGAQRDANEPVIGAHEVVFYDLAVLDVYRPAAGIECGLSEQAVYVILQNQALEALTDFEITVDITGDITDQITYTYTNVLPSYSSRDTVLVGTFDARSGGIVDITVSHNVPDDANPLNDIAMVTREFSEAPFEPTVTDLTVCGATDPVTLQASSPAGEITWYTSSQGGFALTTGDEYETTPLLGTSTFFLEVEHDVTGCKSDFRTPISVISNRLPQVSFAEGNDFDGVIQSGSAGNPDVAFYGGTNTYDLLPMFGLENSNYGSSGWEITGWSFTSPSGSAVNASLNTPSGGQNGTFTFTPVEAEVSEVFHLHLELINHVTGCEGEVDRYISVVDGPVALFSAESDVCDGSQITFVNNSVIASGEPLDYEWNMGDGSIISRADTSRVLHTYNAPGTYQVTLRAWSLDGTEGNITHSVTVHPQPEAMFSAADEVCAGIDVAFTNQSDDKGESMTYSWAFGDGSTSNAESPVHQYVAGGMYNVMLTAESAAGCVSQHSEPVDIFTLPQPAIVAAAEACAGTPVSFSSELRSSSNNYGWDFGDGVKTGMDVHHSFAESGTYQVMHTVTTPRGCQGIISHELEIHPLPSSDFSVSMEDMTWVFTPEDESAAHYHWDFGDQNSSNAVSPSHIYERNGYYNVVLTVESSEGCVSMSSQTEEVMNSSIAQLPAGMDFTAYPNPFGKEPMQVNLSLEASKHVRIELQDMLGRSITMVADERMEAGSHSYVIDGRSANLSTGVYLLKVTAGEETFRHQVIYQR